jgi:hypothetical protein
MSEPPEGTTDKPAFARVVAAVGCLFSLVLAVKMGAESFHARAVGSLMSNWKGGTMAYQEGFKLAAVFAAFAAAFCYFAVRPRGNK